VRVRGGGRPPRGAEVGARERLPVGQRTCSCAAAGGHLEVLKWARENGLPVGRGHVRVRGGRRPPRRAEVGARERLPVGTDVRASEGGHLGAEVGARNGARGTSGRARARRGAATSRFEVGARKRLPVGRVDAPTRGFERIRRRSLSRRRERCEGKRRAAERVGVFVVDSRSTIDTGARRREFLASPRAYDAFRTCASVSPAL
jgi:hypothetical protein